MEDKGLMLNTHDSAFNNKGGYKKEKLYYYPTAKEYTSKNLSFFYIPSVSRDTIVVEDENSFLCGFCCEWLPKKSLSSKVSPSGTENTPDTKICRKCLAATKVLLAYSTDEKQDFAAEKGLTIAKSEELSRTYFFIKGKVVVRFDKDGRAYVMCRTCFVWKPRSSYFFNKKEYNPKKIFKLEKSCKCCQSFDAKGSKKTGLNALKNLSLKTHNLEERNTNAFLLYRIYPLEPKRKDLLGIYIEKKRVQKILKRLAAKYDPAYETRGYTNMFHIQNTDIKT